MSAFCCIRQHCQVRLSAGRWGLPLVPGSRLWLKTASGCGRSCPCHLRTGRVPPTALPPVSPSIPGCWMRRISVTRDFFNPGICRRCPVLKLAVLKLIFPSQTGVPHVSPGSCAEAGTRCRTHITRPLSDGDGISPAGFRTMQHSWCCGRSMRGSPGGNGLGSWQFMIRTL
ncbi:MAG: Uncharacterised protein [Cyanobium sp. ARS6]|nr:MAG: Uncharacterised protein [Cyanobium sp. ARS6]